MGALEPSQRHSHVFHQVLGQRSYRRGSPPGCPHDQLASGDSGDEFVRRLTSTVKNLLQHCVEAVFLRYGLIHRRLKIDAP